MENGFLRRYASKYQRIR
ncbi:MULTISPECIES: hypothetical protein [unclassified Bartonella]